MGISENIKALRDKHGLTQQGLAEIAGVSNKAVSAWETGQKEPRMGAIEKIAIHFGIRKSSLIEEDGLAESEVNAPKIIAAHFEGNDYTEEELMEILEYAKYIKSKRK